MNHRDREFCKLPMKTEWVEFKESKVKPQEIGSQREQSGRRRSIGSTQEHPT